MLSEITVQDYKVTDSGLDSFLAKVEATCFNGSSPQIIEILVESPWSDINYYKIIIKNVKILGNNPDLDINFEEEESLKKAVAVFLNKKIK